MKNNKMSCATCIHWIKGKEPISHPVYDDGECVISLGLKVTLIGYNGSMGVDMIITEPDFFCATYERKKKSSKIE